MRIKNKLKKGFKRMGILIGIMIIFSFVIIQTLIILGGKNESNVQVDYVIILGARLYGEAPSRSLLERIRTATYYLKKNKDIKVIATGGQGDNEDISEAEAIKRELVKNDIDIKRIIIEDKSRSTVENLKYSLEKIKEDGFLGKKVRILLVTNGYHLYRSKKIATLLGYEGYGLPAKTPLISLPKSHIREFLSIIKFYIEKENIKKM